MEKRVDLHIHTTASDGADSPADVVALAAKEGLAAIAVTDHDSVAGIAGAMAAGTRLGVEVIPGIEISAEYNGRHAHILGLFIDPDAPAMAPILTYSVSGRETRNRAMVDALAADGFDITMDELRRENPDSLLGRPHIAAHLVQKGYAASVSEVFDRWLGEGKPYYRDLERITMEEAAELIEKAGGVAVIAHPLQYGYDGTTLRAYITAARAAGCRAMEAYYSEHGPAEQAYVLALAKKFGLRPSGGSDYHGRAKPHIRLGTGIDDGLCVPYAVLEGLKELL